MGRRLQVEVRERGDSLSRVLSWWPGGLHCPQCPLGSALLIWNLLRRHLLQEALLDSFPSMPGSLPFLAVPCTCGCLSSSMTFQLSFLLDGTLLCDRTMPFSLLYSLCIQKVLKKMLSALCFSAHPVSEWLGGLGHSLYSLQASVSLPHRWAPLTWACLPL